ncbi:hypothetical protein EDC56_0632 [Sinobacterium caligoides]|uniref:Uncharacterized protein n=1 Tax=Sinobacterium caligoides TaxID=933926 RepID=A0A3N2DZA4_9GAMM|nr:hypothetical protein [Sinobacterium caligoides]ROS05107.1 hypothetical protein EDC56_0632 [Sinobacterium caligoides]
MGVHYSNELPDGTPFYATGDQFFEREELREPSVFTRPSKSPKNGADRYAQLSELVRCKLESYLVEAKGAI